MFKKQSVGRVGGGLGQALAKLHNFRRRIETNKSQENKNFLKLVVSIRPS
jgi:hypothetical protein